VAVPIKDIASVVTFIPRGPSAGAVPLRLSAVPSNESQILAVSGLIVTSRRTAPLLMSDGPTGVIYLLRSNVTGDEKFWRTMMSPGRRSSALEFNAGMVEFGMTKNEGTGLRTSLVSRVMFCVSVIAKRRSESPWLILE